MKAIRKLRPGQPGTKKWLKRYGEKLLCVRYRYDQQRKVRTTTVELAVEESPWHKSDQRIPMNKIVNVRIAYEESHFRKLVKAVGGKWNAKNKVWQLPYREALELGLEKRIIADIENV
ncbi:MAG: hypothetical protein ACE5NM_13225 [Sedimentisphaerales bacterium]